MKKSIAERFINYNETDINDNLYNKLNRVILNYNYSYNENENELAGGIIYSEDTEYKIIEIKLLFSNFVNRYIGSILILKVKIHVVIIHPS